MLGHKSKFCADSIVHQSFDVNIVVFKSYFENENAGKMDSGIVDLEVNCF
jgi:hypothetical protein